MNPRFCLPLLLACALTSPGQSQSIEFQRDVEPILQSRCYSCHGPEKQRGGLRLDRKADAFEGGDSGKILHPRESDKSLLLQRVSSKLNLRAGGPGFDLFEPNTNYVKVYTPRKDFGPEEWRRMVYQSKPRMQLDDTFGAFDCPDGGQIAPRRNNSITALQALNLLNSPFMMQQSAFFAERLKKEADDSVEDQTRLAFRLALARDPANDELTAAMELIREHGLIPFCRALYNTNEFLFID